MSARADQCRACGKPFEEHDGVQPTCAELQRTREEVKKLTAHLARLQAALKTLGHHAAD